MKIPNSNSTTGVIFNAGMSLTKCLDWCMEHLNCFAVHYVQNEERKRCWIHNNKSNEGPLLHVPGTDYYKLSRCTATGEEQLFLC